MTLNPTRHISAAIARPPAAVYAFASNPANLPVWASGLSNEVTQVDSIWSTTSPMGTVTVAFAPGNDYGVLDHHVTLPTGETFYNPLRVIANGAGSEAIFTLFRLPGTDDAAFEADAAAIAADLLALKRHLEV